MQNAVTFSLTWCRHPGLLQGLAGGGRHLEKATQCVPKEEIRTKNPHLKNLYEGPRDDRGPDPEGVHEARPAPLDFWAPSSTPDEHEALFHTPVEGKEPGTVALVNKVGYKLHGRTLRPAWWGW